MSMPEVVTQQAAYTARTSHGSVGPVIAVVAVITILGVIAGMVGRLCSGRRVMGQGRRYDVEGWVERKCSSCLDGNLDPSPNARPPSVPVAEPVLQHAAAAAAAAQAQAQAQDAGIKEEQVNAEEQGNHKPGKTESS